MILQLLNERGSGFTVSLKDLTNEALVDWLAALAYHGEDWSEFKIEIICRIERT